MKYIYLLILYFAFLLSCTQVKESENLDEKQTSDTITSKEEKAEKKPWEMEKELYDSLFKIQKPIKFDSLISKFKYKNPKSIQINYDTYKELTPIDSITYLQLQLLNFTPISYNSKDNHQCSYCSYFYALQTSNENNSFQTIFILTRGYEYTHFVFLITYDKRTGALIDHTPVALYVYEGGGESITKARIIDKNKIQSNYTYRSLSLDKIIYQQERMIETEYNGKIKIQEEKKATSF